MAKSGGSSFDPNKTNYDAKAINSTADKSPSMETTHDEESSAASGDSAKLYIKNFKKSLNPDGTKNQSK